MTINDPIYGKIKITEPVLLENGEMRNLSEINPKFKQELAQTLEKRRQGNYVKILS